VTESSDQKSLIVSLHDAHPGSHAQIAEQVAFLAERGVTRSSILVVPEFHHRGSLLRDGSFCDTISGWQAQDTKSSCTVIFTTAWNHHLKIFPPFFGRASTPTARPNFSTGARRRPDAAGTGPRAFRVARLARDRFVAPAWLMAIGLTNLLAEMGFAYTTRLGEIIPLRPGLNRVKSSQSLCYSTRAGWRRFASAIWNKNLYGRLRGTDLVRLSLHPRDLEFPLMRRQIDQIVRASIKRGFQPTTYGDYVAR